MVTGITVTQGHNGRIYISSNRGDTWTHYDLPFPVGGNDNGRATSERLQVDPNNPSTLFYGSRTAGLWKSADSGRTWTQVTGLSSTTISGGSSPIGVEQVIFDTSGKGSGQPTWIMWATVAPDYANAAGLTSTLYKSTNGGFSWTPVPVPPTVSGYYIPHVVRTSDGNFYVVFNAGAGASAGRAISTSSAEATTATGRCSTAPAATALAACPSPVWARPPASHWHDRLERHQQDHPAIRRRRQHVARNRGRHAAYRHCLGRLRRLGRGRRHRPSQSRSRHARPRGGICETMNASSPTPTWRPKVDNLEETVTLALVTAPPGASYNFINSAGDIGTWVNTDLSTRPTKGPLNTWSSGGRHVVVRSDVHRRRGRRQRQRPCDQGLLVRRQRQ